VKRYGFLWWATGTKKSTISVFFEKTHALLPEETPGFGINLGTGGWMITDTPQKLIGI